MAGQNAYAEQCDFAAAENIIDINPIYTEDITDVTGYTIINDKVGIDGLEIIILQ